MPGLLTHFSVALVGFLVFFVFRNYLYGAVFVLGHLIPDGIRFGVTGVINWTFKFHEIVSLPLFWKLSFTHYVITWIIVFVVIFLVIFGLYKLKKIDKKTFRKLFIADVIFFIAIAIHLILDVLIIEKSYWI